MTPRDITAHTLADARRTQREAADLALAVRVVLQLRERNGRVARELIRERVAG